MTLAKTPTSFFTASLLKLDCVLYTSHMNQRHYCERNKRRMERPMRKKPKEKLEGNEYGIYDPQVDPRHCSDNGRVE